MAGWKLVGIATVTGTTTEVVVGSCSGTAPNKIVPLLLTTLQPANVHPLGFAVVGLVNNANLREFGSEKYYPQKEGSLLNLGPGVSQQFSGRVVFRPRRYNRRWLDAGYPAPVWVIRADVYEGDATTQPSYTPHSFTINGLEAVRDGDQTTTNVPRGVVINE